MIEIKELTKKFGNFTAVDDISLKIPKGRIYGFVGKNGAGKSTTIRVMMNMLLPTAGQVLINNLDAVKDSKQIKGFTSYMPSDITYYDNLKVAKFLDFNLEFSSKTADDVQALAKYFELDLNKKIAELSLGNKKKVSIIAMLLKGSDVMILDEPTSGLDPLMQKKFFDLIVKQKEAGVTIFLSSHNLLEIERYCDKVAIIKDGKIVDIVDLDKVKIKHQQVVEYKTKDGRQRRLDVTGDINDLIKELALLDLEYLEIKNKSVEDEFIGFYEDKEV